MGRPPLVATAVLAVASLVRLFRHWLPGLGRLPGGFVVRRHQVTRDVPLAISFILSPILSAVLWLGRT